MTVRRPTPQIETGDDSRRRRIFNPDPRRWVLVLIFVLAGVLIVTDFELQRIGNKLDRNNRSTIQNRRIGCFNVEAINQLVPPGCADLHIPIPSPPPVRIP